MHMNFGATGTLTGDFGSYHYLAPTIPEPVFVTFQMTFAIITAALISGSFADRMKYGPMILFIMAWHVVVYCPVAHANFHQDGFLKRYGVLDYAGGNVVHISSGVAGLVSAVILGHRKGYGKERFEPSNIVMTFIGMSLLWVGWFGFNAGSAVAANFNAGYAQLVTQISTAVAALSWMVTDWIMTGRPSVLGMINGAVAGLVGITPACGYVDQTAAVIIGLVVGPICFFGARVKHYLGYDDALDAFGVHAIGGITGGIATGFFANPDICGITGVYYAGTYVGGRQLAIQLYGIAVSLGWSAFATFAILTVSSGSSLSCIRLLVLTLACSRS
jgi:ammonium transporter, Amt family